MKSFTLQFILLALSITLWSCKKEAAGPSLNSTSKSKEDYQFYTMSSDILNSTETDTSSNGRIASCGSSSWTSGTGNPIPLFGDQYINYEIVYNGTPCTNGKKRSGTISWFWEKAWIWGNKDSLVYDHYSSDTVSVNGYGRAILNPASGIANKHHEVDITFVGEDTYHWSGTYFSDKSTKEITGNGKIVNKRTGYTIYWNIVTPLSNGENCNAHTHVKGKIEFTNNLNSGVKTSLDYGDGTCDNKITYTNAQGQTIEIIKN